MRTQKAASVELMKWVGSMMREWPQRVLPVVGGDANTWIGRRSDGTEAMAEVVGPFHQGKQTSAGDLFLDSMETLVFMGPASFRERRRSYVLWHARVDEQHRSLLTQKEAKRLLDRVRVCWRLGASDAAGAVSTGGGPHAIADGASPCFRSQRWSKERENCVEL